MIPRLRLFTYFSPMKLLAAAFVITLLLLTTAAWNVWDTYRSTVQGFNQISRLQELSSLINHGAEIQTLAVRLTAATGDSLWEQAYQNLDPQVNAALREVGGVDLRADMQAMVKQNTAARAELMTMDAQAFLWIHEGQITLAGQLLASPPYTAQQQTYHDGRDRLVVALTSYTDTIT